MSKNMKLTNKMMKKSNRSWMPMYRKNQMITMKTKNKNKKISPRKFKPKHIRKSMKKKT